MSEHVGTEDLRPTPTGSGGADEPSAKDKAMESAQAGKQAAGEVAQTAVSKAQDVVEEGKAQARNLVGEARDQLRGHAGDQHRNAVSSLHSLADELGSMAQSGQQGGVATDLVSQAAEKAQSVASWLENRQPEDLLDEVRGFARRRPGAFAAGALIAGVLAGRLTRGVVAVHNDDDAESRPSPGPGGAEAGRHTSAQTGLYGGAQPGTYAADPYAADPYAGAQYGADPGWEPTSGAGYAGPGVAP